MNFKNRIYGAASLMEILIAMACAHQSPSDCQGRLRALLDVGSSSTKMSVSEVQICGGQIGLVHLLDDRFSSPLPLEAEKNLNHELSPKVQDLGVKVFTELRDQALRLARDTAPKYSSVEFAAVGTHAFRTSANGPEFAAKVQTVGIPIVAITQVREGELAYAAAHQRGVPQNCGRRQILVWDVGNGSQQLTWADPKGKLVVQGVSFSSEGFKNRLMSFSHNGKSKIKCELTTPTPNPIGWQNSNQAERLAENLAGAALTKELHYHPGVQCVVGVGGVHNKSIAPQIIKFWPQIQPCVCANTIPCRHRPDSYTRKELQCLALWMSEKTDCDPEIKGPFAPNAVSNLYLVLGFMEQMKINTVETLDVNIGSILALDNSFLKWNPIRVSTLKEP